MLDGFLGQQRLSNGLVLFINLQRLEGRLDDAVEHKRRVHKDCEAEHLEPLEALPAKAERDDPDEEGSACVNGGSCGRADAAGDGQTEKVEATAAC